MTKRYFSPIIPAFRRSEPTRMPPQQPAHVDCAPCLPRRLASVCLLWGLILMTACASSSGAFRVRNPFAEEAAAISERLQDRKDPAPAETPVTESPSPYFGRGQDSAIPAAPTPPSTSDDRPVSAEPAVAVEPRRPVTTGGTPCYRCNGKGYRLSGLAAGSEFVDCAACQGSGRR